MNQLVKGMNEKQTIRYMAVVSSETVETARRLFNMAPTSCAALGRVLTMTHLLSAQLKDSDEQVVVKINGNGPAGTLMAVGHNNGDVKGFISDPSLYLTYNDTGKLAVGKIVGTEGYLSVSRESLNHDPFGSSVQLQTGEIGDDFAYYFALSEQVPSVVSLGVLVDLDGHVAAAGGLLIQMMPGHSEEDIQFVENAIKDLPSISTLVQQGFNAQQIIQTVDKHALLFEPMDVRYHCDCSHDKFYQALATLKKDDIKDLLEKDGQIEMCCSFCDRKYTFKEDELKELLNA